MNLGVFILAQTLMQISPYSQSLVSPIWLAWSASCCVESDSFSLSWSCRTRSSSVSMMLRSSSSCLSPSSSSSSLELLMSLKISLSSSRWAAHAGHTQGSHEHTKSSKFMHSWTFFNLSRVESTSHSKINPTFQKHCVSALKRRAASCGVYCQKES